MEREQPAAAAAAPKGDAQAGEGQVVQVAAQASVGREVAEAEAPEPVVELAPMDHRPATH